MPVMNVIYQFVAERLNFVHICLVLARNCVYGSFSSKNRKKGVISPKYNLNFKFHVTTSHENSVANVNHKKSWFNTKKVVIVDPWDTP